MKTKNTTAVYLHDVAKVRKGIAYSKLPIYGTDGEYVTHKMDAADLDNPDVACSKWAVITSNSNGSYRVVCSGWHPNRQTKGSLYLARMLLGQPKGLQVDHINHNTLDDTRSNIRAVTASQNQLNLSGARRQSRTGVLGVNPNVGGSFNAGIIVNGERHVVHMIPTLKEAKKIRRQLEKTYAPGIAYRGDE